MGSGRRLSNGLAIWIGLRHCCIFMTFVWGQQALVPSPGYSLGCKGWLPAHTNPFCTAGECWQLLQPADLGKGLQILVTFPQPCRELLSGVMGGRGTSARTNFDVLQAGSAVNKHHGRSERDHIPVALVHLFLLLLARLSITKCISQVEQPISPRLCVCVCMCVCMCVCAIIFLLCQKAKPACEEAINLSPCLVLLFCFAGLQRMCWNEPFCCANAS